MKKLSGKFIQHKPLSFTYIQEPKIVDLLFVVDISGPDEVRGRFNIYICVKNTVFDDSMFR